MKTKIFSLMLLSVMAFGLASCSEDELDNKSIFSETGELNNDFDKWIYSNYTIPYNIRLIYQMDDIESDYQYTLAPADVKNSIKLAHIVKYAWIDAYSEVAGTKFMKTYVPKILHFIGSSGYNNTGTEILGTAEGGIKVTLYKVNNLKVDRAILNEYYFMTMHHEFSHILHQTKNYTTDYDLISEGDYVSGDWYLYTDQQANMKGFCTAYAMSEPREDIAEMTGLYLTTDKAKWDGMIANAGAEGASKLQQKLNIVRDYMSEAWGIDIDELRDVVQRRMEDIVSGKVDIDSLDK